MHFDPLKDPRRKIKGNFKYPLDEILFLSISALISGFNQWQSIHIFGLKKEEWLKKYFPFEHGIPSPDTLERVFSFLEPLHFEECFRHWVNEISELTKGEVIAIDGKTSRGSFDKYLDISAKHIVSAYATKAHVCLGQQVVDQKSNEITAIPELLELLCVQGCLVSIDAMGCQQAIAEKIVKKEANYLLAVKLNQKGLHEQIEKVFDLTALHDQQSHYDTGHGRVETRKCSVINDLTFLDGKQKWEEIKAIIKIKTERYNKTSEKTSTEKRYYISSADLSAAVFNKSIRSHWAVENNLHWMLDVSFGEDGSRKRKKNHAINFNIMAKMALTLLKKSPEKMPISHKKNNAILDDQFRAKLLGF